MKLLYAFVAVLIAHLQHPMVYAKNADISCTYRERVRKDVTQPAHTQTVTNKNATDADCCTEGDESCKERLENTVKAYCNRSGAVPEGYKLTTAKAVCGSGFAGEEKGTDYSYD